MFLPISKHVGPLKLDFKDVLLVPKGTSHVSSRKYVSTKTNIQFKTPEKKWKGTPIFTSNMDSTGTLQMYDKIHNEDIVTCFDKNLNGDFLENTYELDREKYCFSTGISAYDVSVIKNVIQKYDPKFICIDVANGYMENFINMVTYFRTSYPDLIIVAGNVVTPSAVESLAQAGADIVKIGIGSGSVCTTRLKTGIGCPQLSAVMDCWEVAQKYKVKIMSDGGIQTPGDICKAYAAGADFVMLGSILAGHKDTTENVIYKDGRAFVEFYGMSSQEANDKYNGGMGKYRTAEGKKVLIPLKGNVMDTVEDILGGVRSCCSYLGAANINQMYKKSDIIKVNQQVNDQYL